MFSRLFARRQGCRGSTQANKPRSGLRVEQLEDRLVPATTPAIVGVQTQVLVNPTNTVNSQVITAGIWQTVASQSVIASANQTGVYTLNFQELAFAGASNRVGVRYLIDGVVDPNDTGVTLSGNTADSIEDINMASWRTLFLTHQINLTAGNHVIAVQLFCTTAPAVTGQELTVYSPVLNITGYNVFNNQPAAITLQSQPLNSASGTPGQQSIDAGAWQTVATQAVTISSSMTGLVDVNFQATAFSPESNHVLVRYLVDGKLDGADKAIAGSPDAADVALDFTNGLGGSGWHTLFLSRQLNLAAGKHTITIQVEDTIPAHLGTDLIVYTPVLDLVAYAYIDGQITGGGLQTQTPANPVTGSSTEQDITAGSWQTVSSISLTIGARASGIAMLDFQAQARTSGANRVFIRYLIDGSPDPNDPAVAFSPGAADSAVDLANLLGNGNAADMLSLTHLLSLSSGAHTISVQVRCTQQTNGVDLQVLAPNLHLTGFANVTPAPYFSYDASTGILTVTGTSGNDTFNFSQSTVISSGTLLTTYTFTMDGSSVSYTSSQVTSVVVNGGGGTDTSNINTNNVYTGADGKTHETVEQVVMNADSSTLQKFDASNNPVNFLVVNNFHNVNANMGHADTGLLYDSPGNDTFVSAGIYSYMSGPNYYHYVRGAGHVYAYTINGGNDLAYHYDGSGPSTYVVSGSAYSFMQGTDGGQTFFNEAVGFAFNYGIARHKSQTVAYVYDSANVDVFYGGTNYSYLYSDDANGNFAMFDGISGFGHVYAYSFVGGFDFFYNTDTKVNSVAGYHAYVTT